MTRKITILGATGSIGVNTLDVAARCPEEIEIFALTGARNVDVLFSQCQIHRPRYAVLTELEAAGELRARLKANRLDTEVLQGPQALIEVAAAGEVDEVMAAIVGAAGLPPTMAAAAAGKRLYLANKEALVMSGRILMQAVAQSGALLLPIDSEHNALFQCMPADFTVGAVPAGVAHLILTASGGPFRETPLSELARVTPAEACTHPNWNMGRKISVDSASMMNKGLEVIEAHWLFGLPAEKIDVILHPQSLVHSLVEYLDGSLLAQLGSPDMRVPIAHALAWPARMPSGARRLDLLTAGRLDFTPLDERRFPCLRLAYQALAAGGMASAIMNAANEVAVAEFLAGNLGFTEIHDVIATTLDSLPNSAGEDLAEVLHADTMAREFALSHARKRQERYA